jgi:hypothetical protein
VPLAFYVYYRVDPRAEGEARQRVEALFQRLLERCSVRGRLLTKRGEPSLWMEAYEGVQDAERFEAALCTEAASLQLDTVVREGTRRNLECFEE